jgi:hypothetical protein
MPISSKAGLAEHFDTFRAAVTAIGLRASGKEGVDFAPVHQCAMIFKQFRPCNPAGFEERVGEADLRLIRRAATALHSKFRSPEKLRNFLTEIIGTAASIETMDFMRQGRLEAFLLVLMHPMSTAEQEAA